MFIKAEVGKRVSLVRSCVLAYVRTAFGGPQERRNASKKNALPEILKHYFVLSVTKRNEKNSTSFQCSTSWHSGEASLVSQIQEISDIIYFVEDTDNSGTEEVETQQRQEGTRLLEGEGPWNVILRFYFV